MTKEIASVYSGKAGKCCCGCSGKHYYSSAHAEWSEKNRGYSIDPKEINDKQVKRIANIIAKNSEIVVREDNNYEFVEIDSRIYITYFKS